MLVEMKRRVLCQIPTALLVPRVSEVVVFPVPFTQIIQSPSNGVHRPKIESFIHLALPVKHALTSRGQRDQDLWYGTATNYTETVVNVRV